MKRSTYISALSMAAVALMGTGMVTPANGQEGGPPGLQKQAMAAMRANEWSAALKSIDTCINTFGARAKDLGFDDKFGWFYFQRGVCLMQLKDYAKAIEAFNECYSKYPGVENEFVKVALFRRGEAQYMNKQYTDAIASMEQFMKERRTTGAEARMNLGQVYSMLAQCYFLGDKPDMTKGVEALSKCVVNRYKGKGIDDSYLVKAFMAMVQACLNEGKPKVVVDFLAKYPSVINLGAVRQAPYGTELLQLSSKTYEKMVEAQKEGKEALANSYASLSLDLASLIPDTNQVLGETAKIVKKLGGLKGIADTSVVYDKRILDQVDKIYKKLKAEKKPLEGYGLMGVANTHLNYGSIRVANKALELLEDRYSVLDKREDNLFQYAITTWTLGDVVKGSELVSRHLNTFPKSRHVDILNTMSLEKLLKDKKFDQCLIQSKKVKETNADDKSNKFYILASYCEAASLSYLKRYAEAVPLFQEFVKNYPDSGYTAQAIYFLGSAQTTLGRWADAIVTFSSYIKKYPATENNPLLANAYYERAYCYMQKGEDVNALSDAKLIVDKFAGSHVYPMALVMIGNIYTAKTETLPQAKEFYLKGYEAAKETKQKNVSSEALYNLMANAAAEATPESLKEAKKYVELFWSEADFAGNPFATQVAVTGLTINKDGGDGFEPNAKKLREIIIREGELNALNPKVEQAIGSYTKLYLETMEKLGKGLSLDAVREHFYNFPGVKKDDVSLRTILRTAVIGVYQDQIKELKPNQNEMRAQLEGNINVFFKELTAEFKPQDLSPYTLLKLGNHLSMTEQPLMALPYFEEIIKRNNEYLKEARFGKAIALGRSKDAAKIDEAIKIMSAELADERAKKNPDSKAMEEAQYYLILFQKDKGDYAQVVEQSKVYMENKAFKKHIVEAQYNLGLAYDKLNKLDQSLASFMSIANANKGQIRWSAPAVEQIMLVLWKRNRPQDGRKPSDRYFASTYGENYLGLTKSLFTRMSISEREQWRKVEALVKKYSADAGVIAEAKAVAERAAAIRESQGKKH
ncbi:MAG: tetratricopeptide repeat protein [Akkermansia sp.]